MPVSRTLVTIVTENRRLDLSVPSALPVQEWLSAAVEQHRVSPGPGEVTLKAGDTVPLLPHTSLDDAGIVDGAVLHLVQGGSRPESE